MLSELTWRRKRAEDAAKQLVGGTDRFVDMGVTIHVVVADPDGETLIPGKPKLRIVRSHHFGGMLDTRLDPPQFCGPSVRPIVSYCSEKQEQLILHPEESPPGMWMQGSMGGGKTTAGCLWLTLRALELVGFRGVKGGVISPTSPRMEEIRSMLFGAKDAKGERHGGLWPREWATFREGDQTAVLATGMQLDFRTAHVQSALQGSPLQGYNWSIVFSDELQDYYDQAPDIRARGRAGIDGRFPWFATITAKDDAGYRTFRSSVEASKDWQSVRVTGPESPFVFPEFWAEMERNMPARDYRRRVLAMDVGPEKMRYHCWQRDRNLRPIPQVGAKDVTSRELSPWGQNLGILVGFDPGNLWDVSIILKAYLLRGDKDPSWWVVDEVDTEQSTTENHVKKLLSACRTKWGVNQIDFSGRIVEHGESMLVRADPYGDTENDSQHPDRTVYTVFRQHGIKILAAAYNSTPTQAKIGRVPREGRFDLVNTLLQDATTAGRSRLFVACDDRGNPCAPRLVKSLEHTERDAPMRKDKNDLSHWADALGYALWTIEKPRMQGRLVEAAR